MNSGVYDAVLLSTTSLLIGYGPLKPRDLSARNQLRQLPASFASREPFPSLVTFDMSLLNDPYIYYIKRRHAPENPDSFPAEP